MQRKKTGILVGSFIALAVISGMITSLVIFHNHKQNEEMQQKMTSQSIEEGKEKSKSIKEILKKSDEMYLESYLGSTHLVELDKENKEEILNELKKIDVKLLVHSKDGTKDLEDYDEFLYAIHIKNKNMKIKTNEKYIIVEDVKGDTKFFEGDPIQLKELNDKLKNTYMKDYNDNKWIQQAKKITLEAKDENKKWELKDKDTEKFIEILELIAPIDKEVVTSIPSQYPDYDIVIETEEKNYKIHFIQPNVLTLDTSDNYVHYHYNQKLWDYIVKNYPVTFDNTDPLKEILKASKVIVDDTEDMFDFEDSTFYHLEMARLIIRAPKEEVDELPMYEPISYQIKFEVNKKNIEVNIYEEYIVYKDKIYRSEKIGESIRSILNV